MRPPELFFFDEQAAFAKWESVRWPNGSVCCHCLGVGTGKKLAANKKKKIRSGLYRCSSCKKQFTVTLGTILQGSHLPLRDWLRAVYLLTTAEYPVNTRQVGIALGITYKSAWLMVSRLRIALRQSGSVSKLTTAPRGRPPTRTDERKRRKADPRKAASGHNPHGNKFEEIAQAFGCGPVGDTFDVRLSLICGQTLREPDKNEQDAQKMDLAKLKIAHA